MGQQGRWEFRCWLPEAAAEAVRARLARHWPAAGRESRTDIYLLPPAAPAAASEGGHLAKLRHGRDLEVKRWLRSAPPLQYWQMAAAPAFPLGPADRRMLAEALGLPPDALAGDALADTLAGDAPVALQASLAAAGARLVPLRKERQRHRREGCTAEVTVVREDGSPCWTVALEAAVPADAERAIAELGLGGRANIHYGLALQHSVSTNRVPTPLAPR